MKPKLTKTFPRSPGVYLFKDDANTIIYIGKAKSIDKRVRSYFQKYDSDWKVSALLDEYADIDVVETKTEAEALLLEAQLIQEHKPKFNVLLKSGQPFLYILFTKDTPPQIKIVRNKKPSYAKATAGRGQGTYFGPFLQKTQARKAVEYLVRTFRLHVCNKKIENGCLEYHIGLCAGSCKSTFNINDYLFRLQLAKDALKGHHSSFIKSIEDKIEEHNQKLNFEKSKHLNEYLDNIDTIFRTLRVKFSPTKYDDKVWAATAPRIKTPIDYEVAQKELQQLLQLENPPRTIDCFDISHFQSSYLVGSCIRFTDGKPDKNKFRRFKIKTLKEQNDYAALQEIVARRYRDEEVPDIVLIDGGKGQLHAVQKIIPHATCISLAKREETLFGNQFPNGIKLDLQTDIGRLLIALRDYAHHFAINYHRLQRKNGIHAQRSA